MMRIGNIWQHRCTCGRVYQAEKKSYRKCPKCRKIEFKEEPKEKIIKEIKIKPKNPSQFDPYKSCSKEMAHALMSYIPVKDFLELPVRPNPYYD